LGAVDADEIETLLHASHGGGAGGAAEVVARGLGVSPGAACGRAVFTADAALDAVDAGDDVILVRVQTAPVDEPGMRVAAGILTSTGGPTSHAAVIARGLGLPAVCGAEALTITEQGFTVGATEVGPGDLISIDGATGEVYVGDVGVAAADVPAELAVLLGWADEVRAGSLGVRANADSGDDARRAREAGAEGIGLCRTEHVFVGERLPVVQRFLLSSDPHEEAEALAELAEVQCAQMVPVLEAMDGLPVTVRLLDAPLHEFLGDRAGELGASALGMGREENPMMGLRGIRLAVLRPDLYRAQIGAVLRAAAHHRSAGGDPRVALMVPLVVGPEEVELVRMWVEAEVADLGAELPPVEVGAMVETPRAALLAGALAEVAEFISFGTNDLTQLTLGFSRDDVSRVVGPYVDQGLLPGDPFTTLEPAGVGGLVRQAVQAARAVNPNIDIGVCGEHAGDPASIALLASADIDYVSCSPPRVPVARLACAQAVQKRPSSDVGGPGAPA
jgi:pyruvate,orthophosphate dikinase